MNPQIPEDLKVVCPNCGGEGSVTRPSFVSDAEGTHLVQTRCSACHGNKWIWALDQQKMAERIATLTAHTAQLTAENAISEERLNCLREDHAVVMAELRDYLEPDDEILHGVRKLKAQHERDQETLDNRQSGLMEYAREIDQLREENARQAKVIERLEAPVSYEEWSNFSRRLEDGFRMANKLDVEMLISSRAKG